MGIKLVKSLAFCALAFTFSACGQKSSGEGRSSRNELTPSQEQALLTAKESEERLLVDRLITRSVYSRAQDPKPEDPNAGLIPLNKEASSFDAISYRIHLDFPAASLVKPHFKGEVEITFRPVVANFQVLKLDTSDLKIHTVKNLGTVEDLRFELRGEKLEIDLNRVYQPTDTLTLAISYEWNDGRGVYFRQRTGAAGTEAIYSQSEPELAKYWFPGNASPNDRATFEAVIRVPKPFVALSNGALVNTEEQGDYRVYYWSQRIPMVSYLFVVTAGKFHVTRDHWNGIPVEFYGPTDDVERMNYSLRDTKDMVEFFSNQTVGVRYPFEKYAQSIVPQYQWGGMEHTTATTLTDRTVHGPADDEEYSSNPLVAHELAHQWFGDLMTCKTWDHIWLNEGFATYFEMLYGEKEHGKPGLYQALMESAEWYYANEGYDPRPVVFPYYKNSLDYYFDGHAYAKGGWVLHMLRSMVGDQTFFKGVRLYSTRNRERLVETKDFQTAMEEVSGRKLDWFFDQWLFKPGYPEFNVSYSYDAATKETVLVVKQTQDLTKPGGLRGTTPLFQGPIDAELDGITHGIVLKGQAEETFRLSSAQAPRYVNFNSQWKWLAKVTTTQSIESWNAQLQSSLDVTARVAAALALSETEEDKALRAKNIQARLTALLGCAQQDGESRVRSACLTYLGTLFAPESDPAMQSQSMQILTQLVSSKDWRVRMSAAAVLGKMPAAQALPVLRNLLRTEARVKVLVNTVKAIGAVKAPESFDLLMAQLGRKSHLDLVRQAALGALGSLKDLRSLDVGEEYTTSRYEDSTRVGAFTLLAGVGEAFPKEAGERARLAIESGLTDLSYRVRSGAITQLGALKNLAAIPALQKVAVTDGDDRLRTLAKGVIAELSKPKP